MKSQNVQQPTTRAMTGRRLASLLVTVLVLLWSMTELISLSLNHTTGPEVYGILAAAIAVAVSILSLALLVMSRMRTLATAGVLVLWAIVAICGLGGVAAHIVGPEEGHGPVDTRPRPTAAPLIFTALGVAGAAALTWGQRLSLASIREGLTENQMFSEVSGWPR